MRKFKAVFKMVEIEVGLSKDQVIDIFNMLETTDDYGDTETYMPVEVHSEHSSAYGFACASYLASFKYCTSEFDATLEPVLYDMNLESEDCIYEMPDGEHIYMSY